MQKEINNLGFVLGVVFELIDSIKNNDTKYLLIFDDSCGEFGDSNAFVDNSTAERHLPLSAISFKPNFLPK